MIDSDSDSDWFARHARVCHKERHLLSGQFRLDLRVAKVRHDMCRFKDSSLRKARHVVDLEDKRTHTHTHITSQERRG